MNSIVLLLSAALLTASVLLADALAAELKPSQPVAHSPAISTSNVCADQLVLLLAEPEQILSLSTLSHEKAGSYYYDKALQHAVNDGSAEELLRLQPDIVIAGAYTTRYSVRLLRESGVRVEILPIANSLQQMIDNLRMVADWVGSAPKAELLITDIRQRLEKIRLARDITAHPALPARVARPLAIAYGANGYTAGEATLRGEMIELAGWENAAKRVGIDAYGTLSLESLISLAPQALITSPYSEGTFSRAQALARHPVIRRRGLDPLLITIPSWETICAGPWSVDVVERLFHARENLLESQRTARPVSVVTE